jgi:hypothetical protein
MTKKLQPFQEKIFMDIESGGSKPGEMTVMMASRNTGKSTFAASAAALRRLIDDALKEKPLTDLVLTESKVFGARYYTIEPVGGNWDDMQAWCKQSFGEPAEVWEAHKFIWPDCGRWYVNDRRFWFRDIKDRDWFVMRWSAT